MSNRRRTLDSTLSPRLNTRACAVPTHSAMSDSLRTHGPWPARLLSPWDFPGKNTGVGCHARLQGIFLTQGSNPCLLPLQHCRQILSLLAPGKPLNTPKVIHSTLLESEETPCGTFEEILGRGRVDVGRRLNIVCVCVCVCVYICVCMCVCVCVCVCVITLCFCLMRTLLITFRGDWKTQDNLSISQSLI